MHSVFQKSSVRLCLQKKIVQIHCFICTLPAIYLTDNFKMSIIILPRCCAVKYWRFYGCFYYMPLLFCTSHASVRTLFDIKVKEFVSVFCFTGWFIMFMIKKVNLTLDVWWGNGTFWRKNKTKQENLTHCAWNYQNRLKDNNKWSWIHEVTYENQSETKKDERVSFLPCLNWSKNSLVSFLAPTLR